ncbi:hypothetical protein [Streptomyces massasporeus]|uniref:hypothetical protein n=1 Tax=Streptomyces massasporeus TaxID=67324 RepID=UPI00368E7CFE
MGVGDVLDHAMCREPPALAGRVRLAGACAATRSFTPTSGRGGGARPTDVMPSGGGRGRRRAHLVGTTGYVVATGLLLAVGLYGSTHGIDLADLRRDLRGVVAAVTLGVVLKAALISGVMVLAFDRPEYLILGIVVAQIDPLSVTALSRDGHMSQRARSLLTAWASSTIR